MTETNPQHAGAEPSSPLPGAVPQEMEAGVGELSQRGQEIPLAPAVAGPWPRYWAKTFDLSLLVFILSLGIAFVAPGVTMGMKNRALLGMKNEALLGIILLPLAVMIETIIYGMFGSTPGKWLLGIRVLPAGLWKLSTRGGGLEFRTILRRNFGAYWSGLGLGIPLVAVFTMLTAYNKALRGEPQPWDSGTDSRCYAVRGSTARTWIGAAITIFLIVGIRVLVAPAAFVETPKGALWAAAAAEINAAGPKQLDENTRLDGAIAAGSTLHFLYTLTSYDPAKVDARDFAKAKLEMAAELKHAACTQDDFKEVRLAGGTVRFTYRDPSGKNVIDVEVPPELCR